MITHKHTHAVSEMKDYFITYKDYHLIAISSFQLFLADSNYVRADNYLSSRMYEKKEMTVCLIILLCIFLRLPQNFHDSNFLQHMNRHNPQFCFDYRIAIRIRLTEIAYIVISFALLMIFCNLLKITLHSSKK